MKKVLVIGAGGAGKSTLGLPVVHLDREYWGPNWTKPEEESWHRRVEEIISGDGWIVDGNYGGTLDKRIAASDTIVFLDLPRTVSMLSVVKRRLSVLMGRTRPDAAPGCEDRLTWEFLSWIWTYPAKRRAAVLGKLQAVRDTKNVHVLRTRAEVSLFLRSVAEST